MNEIYTWPANDYRNYLAHHGILGMKWGIRRFQNPDGSLTLEGRERYGYGNSRLDSEIDRYLSPGLVKQLNDDNVDVLNENKKELFRIANAFLEIDGYSKSEIKKLRESNSGEYHDAFEKAFDYLRDDGKFLPKAEKQARKRFYDGIDGSKSPYTNLPKSDKRQKETEFIDKMNRNGDSLMIYELEKWRPDVDWGKPITTDDNEAATKYFNYIQNKYLDWYFDDAKTPKYRSLLDEYHRNDSRQNKEKIVKSVIKDLSFEVTPESMEFFESLIFYD